MKGILLIQILIKKKTKKQTKPSLLVWQSLVWKLWGKKKSFERKKFEDGWMGWFLSDPE